MTICDAYGCNDESGTQRTCIFTFPIDFKRKKLWIHKLNRATTNSEPSSYAKLCVRHFNFFISPKLVNDVGFENFRLRLKPDAVPTILISENRREEEPTCRPSARAISRKKLQQRLDQFGEQVDITAIYCGGWGYIKQ